MATSNDTQTGGLIRDLSAGVMLLLVFGTFVAASGPISDPVYAGYPDKSGDLTDTSTASIGLLLASLPLLLGYGVGATVVGFVFLNYSERRNCPAIEE